MSFDFVDYKKDFPLLMQQDVASGQRRHRAAPGQRFAGRERILRAGQRQPPARPV